MIVFCFFFLSVCLPREELVDGVVAVVVVGASSVAFLLLVFEIASLILLV